MQKMWSVQIKAAGLLRNQAGMVLQINRAACDHPATQLSCWGPHRQPLSGQHGHVNISEVPPGVAIRAHPQFQNHTQKYKLTLLLCQWSLLVMR